jgi:hypothetical protein
MPVGYKFVRTEPVVGLEYRLAFEPGLCSTIDTEAVVEVGVYLAVRSSVLAVEVSVKATGVASTVDERSVAATAAATNGKCLPTIARNWRTCENARLRTCISDSFSQK